MILLAAALLGAGLVGLALAAGRRIPPWLAVLPVAVPFGVALARTAGLAPRLRASYLAAPALARVAWVTSTGDACAEIARAGTATALAALVLLLGGAFGALAREPRNAPVGASVGLVGLGVIAAFVLEAWVSGSGHAAPGILLALAAVVGTVLVAPAALAGDARHGGPEVAATSGLAFALAIAALAAASVTHQVARESQTKVLADAAPAMYATLQAAAHAPRSSEVLLGTFAATLATFVPLLAAGAAAALADPRRRLAALLPLLLVPLGPWLVRRADADGPGLLVQERLAAHLWEGAGALPRTDRTAERAGLYTTLVWTPDGSRLDGAPVQDLPADLASARDAEQSAANALGKRAPGRLQVAVPGALPWSTLEPIGQAAAQTGWTVDLVTAGHGLVPLPGPGALDPQRVRIDVDPEGLVASRPGEEVDLARIAFAAGQHADALASALALPPAPQVEVSVAPGVTVQQVMTVLDALARGPNAPPVVVDAP